MGTVRVAINGFGRIGRLAFRLIQNHPNIELVAINDLAHNDMLAHLLKYDSAHGRFEGDIQATTNSIIANGKTIHAYEEADPTKLPWGELNIDIVLECTGRFRKRADAEKHLAAGAKKVIISAPAKDEVKMVVLGINEQILTADDTVMSNASCTTNCLAQMVKVLDDSFGLQRAYVTTVHAYTADQRLQDAPHSDWRRARAAANNIVPTTTNAGTALGKVIPEMDGLVHASATRVPVIDGSLTELTGLLKREASVDEIKAAFKAAANSYLEYTEDQLVSSDIVGNPHSCIFDAGLTQSYGNFVQITGWYDNEYGYANRLVELVDYVSNLK